MKRNRRKGFRIILLLSTMILIGINNKTDAQGWTFTFQLAHSGPCTGVPDLVVPAIPNLGIPTKSQCESLRQMIFNISTTTPVTNDQGQIIGYCKLYFNCTPCTGSDISTTGPGTPGDVSFNNQTEGKPLFTPHQSEAFEDWARDYKALLESYGITSILGNQLGPLLLPSTGDKKADETYKKMADDFNPPETTNNTPNQDASVVDLSGKKGIVRSLTTPEQQQQRDQWYQDQARNQGINDLAPISPVNGITDQGGGTTWNLQDTQHLLFVGAGIAATATILLAAAPEVATVGVVAALGEEVGAATVVSWSLPVVEESVKAIENCASGNCPTTGEILVNMGMGELSNVVGTSGEIASGIASAATQRAVGTISTQGVTAVKYVWNASFGASDAAVQGWGALHPEHK